MQLKASRDTVETTELNVLIKELKGGENEINRSQQPPEDQAVVLQLTQENSRLLAVVKEQARRIKSLELGLELKDYIHKITERFNC
ncbi:hypothetical protein GEMRC1_010115 [Eukaryota sp. GEM-RC1]